VRPAQQLQAHVDEQRRQLAWAAKHLEDHEEGEGGDTSRDLGELRIALLKALAGTLEAEQIANSLAYEDSQRAVRQ
jgi:hypothetical protein